VDAGKTIHYYVFRKNTNPFNYFERWTTLESTAGQDVLLYSSPWTRMSRVSKPGIASTLMATVPIIILPILVIVHKIKPSPRAVFGTVIAVIGIALLFLR